MSATSEKQPKEGIVRIPTHLNGNLICAIDVETTGLISGKHDIIQICILPLNQDLSVCKKILPFYLKLQPKRPENYEKAAGGYDLFLSAMKDGMEAWTAVDRFEEWFNKLPLAPGKKIVPLGHNYVAFDKLFITEWLGGPQNYEQFFFFQPRDSMIAALFLNDVAYNRGELIKFARVGLGPLCTYLGVKNEKAHDALYDCLACVEVYKKLMVEL